MINKITLTFVMAIISSESAFALTDSEQKQVDHLVMLFKQNHPQKIALSIQYPLQREAPIPAIQNTAEMEKRFNQVFDAQLKQDIANSQLSQWSSMGWRGLMLDNGKVWLDGGKITAVNYSSKAERQYKQDLLAQQKQQLEQHHADNASDSRYNRAGHYLRHRRSTVFRNAEVQCRHQFCYEAEQENTYGVLRP